MRRWSRIPRSKPASSPYRRLDLAPLRVYVSFRAPDGDVTVFRGVLDQCNGRRVSSSLVTDSLFLSPNSLPSGVSPYYYLTLTLEFNLRSMDSGHRPHNRQPPPREDCWSEAATAVLIEAWGDRYLHMSRGILRQKDWSEVADAVNQRQDELGEPHKSDVQCKNRVDTIKKKYKAEKSRPGISQWPFFSRLDLLIGASSAPTPPLKKHSHPPPAAASARQPNPSNGRRSSVSFTVKHRNPNPSANGAAAYSGGSSSRSPANSRLSSESSREDHGSDRDRVGDDDVEVDHYEVEEKAKNVFFGGKRQHWGSTIGGGSAGCGGGGAGGEFGELAKAILNFADTYERVESLKQQHMLEMERKRMDFAKDLEFQRMQMFMEAQLEIEKMKRPKYASGSGKRL